jgi:hypothetical protein
MDTGLVENATDRRFPQAPQAFLLDVEEKKRT